MLNKFQKITQHWLLSCEAIHKQINLELMCSYNHGSVSALMN